ncbi:MAG: DUF1501 domain-containing protein [Planctomycetes bacterium]|nr:DUF1501 domain-containing protein [Planctomycetota bacterium]
MSLQSILQVGMSRHGVVSRRGFLRSVGVGAAGLSALGWSDLMTLKADELRKKGMACIVLWMGGGPSQFETFDPKPGTSTGGETKAISTAVSGIEIAEHWPETANITNDLAIIRSMTNKEGNHQRASYQLHTGYVPSGSVKYPSFGSLVCSEISDTNFDLPHYVFVQTGPGGQGFPQSAAFLGVEYDPFVVGDPARPPANTALPQPVAAGRFNRRVSLLKKLEKDFADAGAKNAVEDHQSLYDKAANMVLSPRIKAFDLSQEPDKTQKLYGENSFSQGCLLARRLVEVGVTYIEIRTPGNWDTHQQNFTRVPEIAKQVDPGMAALVRDLKDRGMLDTTLVVWMGEFGRTPRINPNAGRDHWPKSFNVVLAGGGVRGGQVIGSTNADGTDIKDRPVNVADLFCSMCHSLKIDPRRENTSPLGRPLKIVDGGSVVKELFA